MDSPRSRASTQGPAVRNACDSTPSPPTEEEPDCSLDEHQDCLAERQRLAHESSVLRRQLDTLKETAALMAKQLDESKLRQQEALDKQHATYLDIVHDLELCLKRTESERDLMSRRAEAAEAKVETLAMKIAGLIRRGHSEQEAELRDFAERVSSEKHLLVEALSALGRDVGVDATFLLNSNGGGLPTMADVTAWVELIRSKFFSFVTSISRAATPVAPQVAQLHDKLAMAVIIINRRLDHQDVVTGGVTDAAAVDIVASSRALTLPRYGAYDISKAAVATLDDEGGDEDVFDALRIILTDAIVSVREIGDAAADLCTAVREVGQHVTDDDVANFHSSSVKQLSQQLERQIVRHAHYRTVSKAMLDAAEEEYMKMLQLLIGSAQDYDAAAAAFTGVIRAAASTAERNLSHPSPRRSPTMPVAAISNPSHAARNTTTTRDPRRILLPPEPS